MKALKTVLLVLGSVVVLLVIVFGVYLLLNRQGVITSSSIGKSDASKRILIASQGSSFKNALVDSLVARLQSDQILLHVIDVSSLGDVNEDDWNAAVLIHTTENWRVPPDVAAYLNRAKALDRMIVVTTSGSGEWRSKEYAVDVITSASKPKDLPVVVTAIVAKLQKILQTQVTK